METKSLLSRLGRWSSGALALCCVVGSPAFARGADSDGAAASTLISARQKFFGAENVDARTGAVAEDKVIFSWGTCTTVVTSVKGRVVLLDSFVMNPDSTPGRTPFTVEDLVSVHPEAIFLGHGHYDHADNAAYMAKKLDIPIYASAETCDIMQQDAAYYFGTGSKVKCVSVVSPGSTPGTEVFRISQLEPLACIVGFKHLHSVSVPHDPEVPLVTIKNVPDPRDKEMYRPETRIAPWGAKVAWSFQRRRTWERSRSWAARADRSRSSTNSSCAGRTTSRSCGTTRAAPSKKAARSTSATARRSART
jgi:hypothetical protein